MLMAPSYVAQDWLTIARNAAQQNHQKYEKAAEVIEEALPH